MLVLTPFSFQLLFLSIDISFIVIYFSDQIQSIHFSAAVLI